MNLLYCTGCRHAFTAADGSEPAADVCVLCGDALSELARDVIQVSPMWEASDSRSVEGLSEAPSVTSVAIRHRGTNGDGGRILVGLADYFQVIATDAGAQVCVDRGPPTDAPWRVAAILDGIDGGWEEHFVIPELETTETGTRI
jgi:hypothetical protein